MITIGNQRLWVPDTRVELEKGLKRMGITKVAGVPFNRLSKKELKKAYCRERARIERRRQMEANDREEDAVRCGGGVQLSLLPG